MYGLRRWERSPNTISTSPSSAETQLPASSLSISTHRYYKRNSVSFNPQVLLGENCIQHYCKLHCCYSELVIFALPSTSLSFSSFYLLPPPPETPPRPSPSPQLVSVLREVKYLKARQTESIPDTAEQMYTSRGQLWQYIANLELTVRRYNKVVSTVLEVEHPLVQGQLRDIDTHLREAEEDINWNSQGALMFQLAFSFSLGLGYSTLLFYCNQALCRSHIFSSHAFFLLFPPSWSVPGTMS